MSWEGEPGRTEASGGILANLAPGAHFHDEEADGTTRTVVREARVAGDVVGGHEVAVVRRVFHKHLTRQYRLAADLDLLTDQYRALKQRRLVLAAHLEVAVRHEKQVRRVRRENRIPAELDRALGDDRQRERRGRRPGVAGDGRGPSTASNFPCRPEWRLPSCLKSWRSLSPTCRGGPLLPCRRAF